MDRRNIITLILTLAAVCGGASAQQKQEHARIPISRSVGKGKVVDQTKVRVWYALNADKIDDMNTCVDFQRLDIGDSITKCYSWFVFNSDSLRTNWSKKNRNAKSAPMNTYGPRMAENDGRVISNFITQALEGKAITIYGDGSQTRSFQYVDDLIEAMMRFVNTEDDFTGPINIGNPYEITIKTLAEMVIALTKSHSQIISRPLPENDPRRRSPDISLATSKLDGWMPQVHLEKGIRRTIDFFMSKGGQQKDV